MPGCCRIDYELRGPRGSREDPSGEKAATPKRGIHGCNEDQSGGRGATIKRSRSTSTSTSASEVKVVVEEEEVEVGVRGGGGDKKNLRVPALARFASPHMSLRFWNHFVSHRVSLSQGKPFTCSSLGHNQPGSGSSGDSEDPQTYPAIASPLQDDPKKHQDGRPQGAPQDVPTQPKDARRLPQDATRVPQNRPKTAQDRFKISLRPHETPKIIHIGKTLIFGFTRWLEEDPKGRSKKSARLAHAPRRHPRHPKASSRLPRNPASRVVVAGRSLRGCFGGSPKPLWSSPDRSRTRQDAPKCPQSLSRRRKCAPEPPHDPPRPLQTKNHFRSYVIQSTSRLCYQGRRHQP